MATINTTDPKPGFVYDQAVDTWFPIAGIAAGSSVDRYRKTAAGSETSISGLDDLGNTLAYEVGTEQVYLNGVLLVRIQDYTATNGTSITGLSALAASDVVEIISFNPINIEKTDAILTTAINAKGDLIVGSADNTPAILAVGTNGHFLKANSATATGLEFAAAGDVTLTGTQTLTNKTLTSPVLTTPSISTIDAKGDLLAGTADNTIARLAVGTNGQVLTADSSEATGLKFATPASGAGLTLITTTSFTATTSVISAAVFSATYDNYLIIFTSDTSNDDTDLRWRTGSTTTTTGYVFAATGSGPSSPYSASNYGLSNGNNAGTLGGTVGSVAIINVVNPFRTQKTFHTIQNPWTQSGTGMVNKTTSGFVNNTTSYDKFDVLAAGNITGFYSVYGYAK